MMDSDGEVTAVEPRAPTPGSTVGPWLILEQLDAGSYGIVYRARRAGHSQAPPVALKMARTPRDARFEREGAALKALSSVTPHVPRMEDVGVWTGPAGHRYPYFVMELVEGLNLYDWMRAQRRTSRDVLRVLAQVASALVAAHARGVIHRDAKGGNIRVQADGRAVLLDWGACWFPEARPLTDTPTPPGTTAYRPPEQKAFMWQFRRDSEARWQSKPGDDLYALGVTLYRAVTGVYLPPCTEGGEPVEREVLPPSAMATVCLELGALILRLISEKREARGSTEQLAREAQVLADTAGPEADEPILPRTRLVETDELSESSGLSDTDRARSSTPAHPERLRPSSTWLSWAGAGMAGGLVAALLMVGALELRQAHEPARPAPWLATPEEVALLQEAPFPEARDGGVGDEALASAQDAPRSISPLVLTDGQPMPSTPLPGQRTPPCKRGEKEINGGCWVGPIEDERPPCGDTMYDYQGRCYVPMGPIIRTPTSEQP